MKDETKKYITAARYAFDFMLASHLGWLYEIVCVWILLRAYYDRGVLHLPMCPIYGFGLFVLLVVFRKNAHPLPVFAGSFLITSVIELAASYIVEYGFHTILWTYEGWPLNFQNRISAVSSGIFALMAVLFINVIRPLTEKLFSSRYGRIAAVVIWTLVGFCILWEVHCLV